MDAFDEKIKGMITKFISIVTFGIDNFEIDGLKIGIGIVLLNYIGSNPNCNMKDISNFLNVPASTATRRIDKLYDMNLISRHIDDEDRRLITIQLTKRGKEIFKKFLESRMKTYFKIKEDFTEDEIMIFYRFIKRYVELEEESKSNINNRGN